MVIKDEVLIVQKVNYERLDEGYHPHGKNSLHINDHISLTMKCKHYMYGIFYSLHLVLATSYVIIPTQHTIQYNYHTLICFV